MVSGGYRKPSNPTPLSLPGALSSRTDGNPTQAPMYMPGMKSMGSTGREQMAQEQGAALYKAPTSETASLSGFNAAAPVTPITAGTALPDQHIADGTTAMGGNGPEALNLPSQGDNEGDKARLASYLPAFEISANMPNASMAWKNYVRLVRSMV
jgi:hypothetical protein